MRQTFIILLIVVASSSVFGQSERSLIRQGNQQYNKDKFADAEVNYRKSLEKNKDTKQGAFNLGDALFRQERYGEAAEQYRIASEKLADNATKAQALHNMGNSLLKEQKFPESINAYKEALKLNPKDEDTKYNLEYAKRMLQKQQQQQQQQQKQDKDKKDDQKKDDKEQQQKEQDQKKQEQQKKEQQQQQKKQQLSKEDAERILEALKNEEKDVQKKLKKQAPARVSVEKDW
jgi:tetratricopeptide (TPR) repeat protein